MIKKKTKRDLRVSLPSDDRISSLCRMIETRIQEEETRRRYAPVKHVLTLVGLAGVVGLSFIAPTAVQLAKPFLDAKRREEYDMWKRYNPSFLRRSIERLKRQKLVEVREENGKAVVTLSVHGKKRILKYALNELSITKPKRWDGQWRLVLYDVDSRKKHLRDAFRSTLRSLGFLQLQESAWLYPYPCEEQISFLREYYGVGNEVVYVIAKKIEDDHPYKTYFGLH